MPGAADEQRVLAAGLEHVAQPLLDVVHDFEEGRVHVAYKWPGALPVRPLVCLAVIR